MSLPPLYARWLEDVALPEERRATCHDCVMCPKADGTPPVAQWAFRPDVKCCTYTPRLPNFLVGRILADGGDGAQTVRARIAAGVGVTPLGLDAPPLQEHLKRHSPASAGRAEALRCPHFRVESGDCAIWAHRNGVCATWFCKHERGQTGLEVWFAAREMLTAVEHALSQWCLLELGVDVGRLPVSLVRRGAPPQDSQWLPSDLDGHGPPGPSWGERAGDEEGLYRACAELVDALSWDDVRRICGPDVALFDKVLGQARARLESDDVPESVSLGPMQVLGFGEDGAWVVTYSPHDPVGLPALLVSVLHHFDGRPLEEVARVLAEERGLRLDPELLRTLLDWRVLTPSDG